VSPREADGKLATFAWAAFDKLMAPFSGDINLATDGEVRKMAFQTQYGFP